MRKVNLPDGFPRLGILLVRDGGVYCSLCSGEVNLDAVQHTNKNCRAVFVAIGSSLGTRDSKLKARPDLAKVAITRKGARSSKEIWLSPSRAEALAPMMGWKPTRHAGNTVRRLIAHADSLSADGRQVPFEVREGSSGEEEVEFRSVLRVLDKQRPGRGCISGIGSKSEDFVRSLVRWADAHPEVFRRSV